MFGRVERAEERPHVVERGRVEVREVAVEVVRVVPVLIRRHRQVDPREPAVRLVEDVDLDFVLDHLLLVLEVVGADVEAAHPVGLGPENRLEHVRRHDLEVVREVEARRSVEEPAVRFDQADELHLAEVLRALEHHVLEEVREAGLVLRLVPEADVVGTRPRPPSASSCRATGRLSSRSSACSTRPGPGAVPRSAPRAGADDPDAAAHNGQSGDRH